MALIIENPPKEGEYRVINQLEEVYELKELAEKVQKVAKEFGLDPEIQNIENPRVEKDNHRVNVDHEKLFELGYKPTSDMDNELRLMFKDLIPYKKNIVKECLMPKTQWK